MIEYVEVRRKSDLELIGIIDGATSVIWHRVYFGVGDFEIYIEATGTNLELLEKGNYITRPNDTEVGIIENIAITSDVQNGNMIKATGRFAKSILDRRRIFNLSDTVNMPTVLTGNVEAAVRDVVSKNAINCQFDYSRNMAELALGDVAGLSSIIVDESGNAASKQAATENLLEYTDSVLQEYNISASVKYDEETGKLKYFCFSGVDRSSENTDGNYPVIFSEDYDNLTSADYNYTDVLLKTSILVGGEGEGLDRFYALIKGAPEGIDRRETFLDANSINRVLKEAELESMYPTGIYESIYFKVDSQTVAEIVEDTKEYTLNKLQTAFPSGTVSESKFLVDGETYANLKYGETNAWILTKIGYRRMLDAESKEGEYSLTEAAYTTLLNTAGKQELAKYTAEESFNGKIDVTGGAWKLKEDYDLGDIVTVQSNSIGKYIDVRITEITEVQDNDGYLIDIVYTN